MLHNSKLSFQPIDLHACGLLGILDVSYYSPLQEQTGMVLQIIRPDRSGAIEVPYIQNGITVFNSNSLGITNVMSEEDLTDLPDGAYTVKMSMCPYDQYWYEATFYRTCQLMCKYYKAILKLDLTECQSCFSPETDNELQTVKRFIDGIHANVNDGNIKQATKLYRVANYILDDILQCNCSNDNKGRGWGQGKRHKGFGGNLDRYGFQTFSPTGNCCS